MTISNDLFYHTRNSSLLSQFHTKVFRIDWELEIRIRLVFEGILSVATIVGKQSCLKSASQNRYHNRGFQRLYEGLKVPDFDFSVFFFFNALVSAFRISLQSSASATFAILLQLPSLLLLNSQF